MKIKSLKAKDGKTLLTASVVLNTNPEVKLIKTRIQILSDILLIITKRR